MDEGWLAQHTTTTSTEHAKPKMSRGIENTRKNREISHANSSMHQAIWTIIILSYINLLLAGLIVIIYCHQSTGRKTTFWRTFVESVDEWKCRRMFFDSQTDVQLQGQPIFIRYRLVWMFSNKVQKLDCIIGYSDNMIWSHRMQSIVISDRAIWSDVSLNIITKMNSYLCCW